MYQFQQYAILSNYQLNSQQQRINQIQNYICSLLNANRIYLSKLCYCFIYYWLYMLCNSGYIIPYYMTFRFIVEPLYRILNTAVVLFGIIGGFYGLIGRFS
ncbi:unnamed protein product [Paramecium pentaurelia]|uniref:Transmembrane protein n=1 Tax=Paramecium pentaurelia TaxID=43138 RepID=A0A8S1XR57_9CILI|nr:unnamed protein product [Paramecium pentaurelia]